MSRVYPHMLAWREDPADPGRPTLDNPHVQRLLAEIAPGSTPTDLGGTFSLNVGLQPAGLVLRVHQPFVTRRRLDALHHVRRQLAEAGPLVPVPLPWRGATVFRCGGRWAELEAYIPSEQPGPTPDSYTRLFREMGTLHRALAATGLAVPRPVIATYAPPGTLLRWLPITEKAVRGDPGAEAIARHLRELVGQLRAQWIPATALPGQLVHGDMRLGNVRRTPAGETVYLDFGFTAHRPRIHDLGYTLAWIVLGPDSRGTAEGFAWGSVRQFVRAYEEEARIPLAAAERKALAPYTAAIPLYQATVAGFMGDPAATLRDNLRRPFMKISEWLLAHPDAVLD